MKTLLAFLLALSVLCLPMRASVIQVTTVGAVASTIVTPGRYCKVITIQNNGAGDVRLSFDGGSVYGLTDPTSSTGYKLASGAANHHRCHGWIKSFSYHPGNLGHRHRNHFGHLHG